MVIESMNARQALATVKLDIIQHKIKEMKLTGEST